VAGWILSRLCTLPGQYAPPSRHNDPPSAECSPGTSPPHCAGRSPTGRKKHDARVVFPALVADGRGVRPVGHHRIGDPRPEWRGGRGSWSCRGQRGHGGCRGRSGCQGYRARRGHCGQRGHGARHGRRLRRGRLRRLDRAPEPRAAGRPMQARPMASARIRLKNRTTGMPLRRVTLGGFCQPCWLPQNVSTRCCFFSCDSQVARIPCKIRARTSCREKPSRSSSCRYSSARELPNICGSSVLMVTTSPRSKYRRTGCSSIDFTTQSAHSKGDRLPTVFALSPSSPPNGHLLRHVSHVLYVPRASDG